MKKGVNNMTINHDEILNKIKNEIYKIHPVTNPRKNNEIKSVMEIYFTIGETYDNIPITTIKFLDGDEYSKSSTPAFYKLDEYINLEIVNKLISYLLVEYPYINDLSISSMSFSLSFIYPFEMENKEGISCDKIILKFNTRSYEFIPILNNYLINILLTFTNELSQTQTFQDEYSEYCNHLQKSILDSLSEKEIEQMIKILPNEIKRKLLKTLSSQYFSQFYQDYYHNDEVNSKKLIKSEKKLPSKF